MSEWQYIENLALLERRGSKYPLLGLLKQGYSPVNVIYMTAALKNLPPEPETPKNEEKQEGKFDLKRLYQQKQTLFGERAQLSNKMMKLPDEDRYNKERGKYSDLIQEKQRAIADINLQIALMEQGIEPLAPEPEKPVMSEADMIRRLASLRASRSRKRKQAETAKGEDLIRINAEIDHFNRQIQDVESALENKTV
jgi:septal ring factor EnvC (AmiA/AmiB activator)